MSTAGGFDEGIIFEQVSTAVDFVFKILKTQYPTLTDDELRFVVEEVLDRKVRLSPSPLPEDSMTEAYDCQDPKTESMSGVERSPPKRRKVGDSPVMQRLRKSATPAVEVKEEPQDNLPGADCQCECEMSSSVWMDHGLVMPDIMFTEYDESEIPAPDREKFRKLLDLFRNEL
jgi:hypothetical protein